MQPDHLSYTHVYSSTIRGDLPISFDLYLKVAGKYILYCKEGEKLEGERLERLQTKNFERLFLKTEDMAKYQKYLTQNIDRAFNTSESMPLSQRVEIIQGYLEAALFDVFHHPTHQEFYRVLKKGAQRFQDFLKAYPLSLKHLVAFKNPHLRITQHSVNVAAWSYYISQSMDVNSEALDHLMLGALLHDLALINTSLPLYRPRAEMSLNEHKQYHSHSTQGADLLAKTGFCPDEVIEIVANHHEQVNGEGFPNKKAEKQLSPLSQIVATANAFDRLLSFEQMSPRKATKQFLIDSMGLYSLEVLKALQVVIRDQQLLD